MVAYASKSYQMAGEMFIFTIYPEKSGIYSHWACLKPSQFLVNKKEAPILHQGLGTILHRAIVTPLSEVLIPHLCCHFLGPHPVQDFLLTQGGLSCKAPISSETRSPTWLLCSTITDLIHLSGAHLTSDKTTQILI